MECPSCHTPNPDTSRYCGNCAALLTPSGGSADSVTRMLDVPPDTAAPGSLVAGKFRIARRLGQGGMGVVYLADDLTLKRPVALKFLPPDLSGSPDLKERFVVEAQAAAALSHPNICVVHEVGEAGGQLYIAMEYVEGETLRERIRRGRLGSEEAVAIATQVAAGLAEAHGKGVVHRDIKAANIMLARNGRARIMDFGLAKLQGGAELTRSRTTMGTVPYMSPEQARGDRVDRRTDIWALGVVLYEMLTGDLPFKGGSDLSVIQSILNDEPRPFGEFNQPVPDELKRVTSHALRKDLSGRYGSAEAMLRDLRAYQADLARSSAEGASLRTLARQFRRPRVAVPAIAALLTLVGFGTWSSRQQANIRWAREVALPEIERIVSQNWRDFDQAYALAERAEQFIPGDAELERLFARCSFRIDVTTEPPGAKVWVKPYTSPDDPWKYLGVSPVQQVRLPLGNFRWRLEKEGYETVLAAGSSWDVDPSSRKVLVPGRLARTLDQRGALPQGMVRVAGATTATGSLGDFFIDAHEVTNRQFKAFVDAGGYSERKYWTQAFADGGEQLTFDAAIPRFVDATGRPGPATWHAGEYPEGRGDDPVSGVSWYEAAAYTAFAGKSLPTSDHWGLARGEATPIVQWPQLGGDALFAPFSNFFKGKGAVAAGSLAGITAYGAFDMAGNVREWCWNRTPKGRLVRGGAWDDNTYMFGALSQAPPMDRSPKNGFRCAVYLDPKHVPAAAFDVVAFEARTDHSTAKPVPDAVFEVYRDRFSYDKTALDARTESSSESPGWKLEKVSFNAAYGGERVAAWLFLPTNAAAPFQTVVYFPGSASTLQRSSEDIEHYYEVQGFLSFIVKNGRAVLFPVYKGTFERGNDALAVLLHGDGSSREYSEVLVQVVKDFRRSIDYLETRPDIDSSRIAYYGMSRGATLGAIIPAVEDRIRASVLVAGGLGRVARPEAHPVTYASRVRIPTLMVNGKYDTLRPYETSQKPMFDLLGAREKHLVLDETDHIPTTVVYVRETLAWLDRHLGPVKR